MVLKNALELGENLDGESAHRPLQKRIREKVVSPRGKTKKKDKASVSCFNFVFANCPPTADNNNQFRGYT
jgi:hypothetical protein